MPDLSYVHGTRAKPLIGRTIGQEFDRACAAHPEALALVVRHQSVRWSYADLKMRVDDLAAGLMARGLAPGERVGIWAPNCAEWVITQFATAKAGLILVNINPSYRAHELEYVLNKVQCKALITAVRYKSSDYLAILRELGSERLPWLKLIITIGDNQHAGGLPFAEALKAEPSQHARLAELENQLQFDDPINIQFTSGTTGFPKAATLSHHNILNNGYCVGESIALRPGDKVCIPVPLYHCFGMVMGNLGCLTHAATMVYPAESFDPRATLAAIEAERCAALYGVPTMFITMLGHDEFDGFNLSSLRTGIMAGSPCPIELMKQVITKMHMSEVTIAYGMTETSPVSFQSAINDPLERRVATVGRIRPHIEAKIVDAEGAIVRRGETGELCIRGYSVMLDYWDDPAATDMVIDRARWMHTGDLSIIDGEGYCKIVGRLKDVVIRGGENIYPREIEDFLHGHPAVQDVQVISVPDPKYGEELCACFVIKPGASFSEEDVKAFCTGRIAHYKIPRYVRFVDSFPTTVTGKVQKFLLRDRVAKELGLLTARTV